MSGFWGCTAWGWEQGIAAQTLGLTAEGVGQVAWLWQCWVFYWSFQLWVTPYLCALVLTVMNTGITVLHNSYLLVLGECAGVWQELGFSPKALSVCEWMCFASVLTSVLLCIWARREHGQRKWVESRGLQRIFRSHWSWCHSPGQVLRILFYSFIFFPFFWKALILPASWGYLPLSYSGILGDLPRIVELDWRVSCGQTPGPSTGFWGSVEGLRVLLTC